MKLVFFASAALLGATTGMFAQAVPRRADIRNDGDPSRGKCTVEVWVDGAAEVEVRGDTAFLRTLSGQPAQWRRFECNAPMPNNPADFRFAGVDGRGRQELVRDPNQGGGPVVRIEDPESGAEGYTFNLFWQNGYDRLQQPGRVDRPREGYPPVTQGYPPQGRPDYRDQRQNPEQVMQVCEDAVRRRARTQYRVRELNVRDSHMDRSRPGTYVGAFEDAQKGGTYRYSCLINPDTGNVRSVSISRMARDEFDRSVQQGIPAEGNRGMIDPRGQGNRSIQDCQRAAEDRLRRDGYSRVDIRSINPNDRSQNQTVGVAEAQGPNGRTMVDFSCSIDPRDGDVRVEVRPRY